MIIGALTSNTVAPGRCSRPAVVGATARSDGRGGSEQVARVLQRDGRSVRHEGREGAMEIVVLGSIAVRVDGREVPVGGPRQRRLLAALVRADGRVVPTGQLADAVWGDESDPPAAGERTLQSYVSRLRTV